MKKSRFTKLDLVGKKATTVLDNTTGLQWAAATLPERLNHADATAAVAKLTLGGFTDWRLPTVEELFCLADRTRRNPAIDVKAFPDTPSDWHWSSSAVAGYPDYAWFVNFYNGYSGSYHRDYTAFVRAVRGPVARSGQ